MRHLILMTVFASGTLLADPVLTFNTATTLPTNTFNQTVGWEFNVLNPITVTGLGWYDQGSDGLDVAHKVGIWDSTGTLLVSATVAGGTTDALDGLFRTVSTAPLVLLPGKNYIVGGQNLVASIPDLVAYGVSPTTDARISFVAGEFVDNTFADPTTPTKVSNCCWGPSFSVDAAANVPEPSGVSALLAAGVLAMLVARRTRRA